MEESTKIGENSARKGIHEGKAGEKLTRKLDLEHRSEQELKEMLEKQERLLLDKNLIQALPDKGKKIAQLVEDIKKVLSALSNVEDAADRLNAMNLGDSELSERVEESVLRDLGQFINQPGKQKMVSDERINFPNSYEFIMKKNCNALLTSQPQQFKPNRLLKDKKPKSTLCSDTEDSSPRVEDLRPSNDFSVTKENSQEKNRMEIENSSTSRLKYRYDASLEETFSYDRPHSQGVRMIDIEESIKLLNKHQAAMKEAELKRAEALLLANSMVKISGDNSQWHGEKFNRYRDDRNIDDEED